MVAAILAQPGFATTSAVVTVVPVRRPHHVAFVTSNFPSRAHPDQGTFVRQLVEAVAEQGVRCTVIHPWKLLEWLRERRDDGCSGRDMVEGVRLYRPLTLSVSNRRLGPWNTFALTNADFQRAVRRVLRRLPEVPDVIYGHFLYSAGAAAVRAAQRLGRPGFVAVGESLPLGNGGLWSLEHVRSDVARRLFACATGFIAVSSLLRGQLVAELGVSQTKIGVFPNGIDPRRFYPRDRETMRRKHRFPQDCFLVVFIGTFDERKGIERVLLAIRDLPKVRGVFVGEGPLRPKGDQVAFCGRVPHEQVPELLSAADLFVLPSRTEGSSNATLEAMACGLPVVVSARPFNEDICGKDNAWLVEPDDVQGIRNAIVTLQKDFHLRQCLAQAASSQAARFDIRARARRILEWMVQRIADNEA